MSSMCTGDRVFLQHMQLGRHLSTPHSLVLLRQLHSKHKDMEGSILTATRYKVALSCGQGVQAVDTTTVSLDSQAGGAQPWREKRLSEPHLPRGEGKVGGREGLPGARQLLTGGQPGLCWRLQGSRAVVQHCGEVPEGQAAIGSCAAQEQSPERRGKAAGSVRATESNEGAQGPRQSHHAALSPPLVRRLVRKGVDLEDTALVVEGFSQELQPLPRLPQMKEPGGVGNSSHPILGAPSLYLPPYLTPCSYLTAPSLQAAATRGPRSGGSSSHTARHMYLQSNSRQQSPA